MGLAFIFRLDESSLAGHVGERAPRTAADTESVAITEAGRPSSGHSHTNAFTMLQHMVCRSELLQLGGRLPEQFRLDVRCVHAAEPLHEEEVDDSVTASEDAEGAEENGSVGDVAPPAAIGEEEPEQGDDSDGSSSSSSSHSEGDGSDSDDSQQGHRDENGAAANGSSAASDAPGVSDFLISEVALVASWMDGRRSVHYGLITVYQLVYQIAALHIYIRGKTEAFLDLAGGAAEAAVGASGRPSASALEAFLDTAADPLAQGAGRSDYARRAMVGSVAAMVLCCCGYT